MLVRTWVAIPLALVMGIGIGIFGAVTSMLIANRLRSSPQSGRLLFRAGAWLALKSLWVWGILALGVPLGCYLGWTTVWIVEDAPDLSLEYRRYKMIWTSTAELTTARGPIRVATHVDPDRGPQTGEIALVVNATQTDLKVDEIRYGGVTVGPRRTRRIPPGDWVRERIVNGIGNPPKSMLVSEKNGRMTTMVYVYR